MKKALLIICIIFTLCPLNAWAENKANPSAPKDLSIETRGPATLPLTLTLSRKGRGNETMIGNPAATTLHGDVHYNVDSARRLAQEGMRTSIDPAEFADKIQDKDFQENQKLMKSGIREASDRYLTFFYYPDGSRDGYAVYYYKDPYHFYHYTNTGILQYVQIKDKLSYPYKSYQYEISSGKLNYYFFDVSYDESYAYSLDGKLRGHWVGNVEYDENNKIQEIRGH